MTMKRHLLLLSVVGVFVLVTAVALIAARSRRTPDTSESAAPAPVDVQISAASNQDLAEPFEIGGDVRARETAVITSRIVAEVKTITVKPGDRVRAGQPLVLLDARDLTAGRTRAQAAVTAAEQAAALAAGEKQAADAALALASATHRRISELRNKNSATPSEMDEAEAGLEAARARVTSAEAQVAQAGAGIEVAKAAAQAAVVGESYATLTAPFDGVVTQKLVDPGNMATPGLPLLTVEDSRAFRLEVRVDESRAALVALGQPVDVAVDGLAAPRVTGRVAEVARVLDPSAHAFLAKIDLPAIAGIRAGMFGRARFSGPVRRALAVPEEAVVHHGQVASVFVVGRSNVAQLRLVTVGEPFNHLVEVRAGLDAGEAVVLAPPPSLVDGMPVRPRAHATPARTATSQTTMEVR